MKKTLLVVTLAILLASVVIIQAPVTYTKVEDDGPIAEAGSDLTVQESQLATFNGSASKGSRGVLVFGDNTNVTEVTYDRDKIRYHGSPDVKVDDTGAVHIAWCGQMWGGYRYIFYSKSTNQGLTFREPLAVSGYLGSEPGCWAGLNADRFGRIHITWTNMINSVHPVAYYRMSPDRGEKFNTPVPIDYGTGSFAGDVFSDSEGTIHMTLSIYGDPGNIHLIKSEDNGSTFSDPVRINDVSGSVSGGSRVRLGPNDSIHAVWSDDRDWKDEKWDVYYSVSYDGGSSFSKSIRVHDKDRGYQTRPTLAVDDGGNPHVVWIEYKASSDELHYSASYDGGASFEEKTLIVDAPDIRDPSIDIGNDGLPQIVWYERGGSYYYNINYTRMDKIEKKFLRTLSVNDDNGIYRKVQPSMDVDSNGTTHVVWADYRNGIGDDRNDIYYARSTLGRAKIVEYHWDTNSLLDTDGDGNSTNDVDVTGPTPSFTYGDDGIFVVTLRVTDELGETAYDTAEVTVQNVNPTILNTSIRLEELNASFIFRIAGEKWHNVEVFLLEDGVEVGHMSVTRKPGNPNNQVAVLGDFSFNHAKTYSMMAYYTPEDDLVNGQPGGATPAWLILSFGDLERKIHHTFNVIHSETWVWNIENLNQYFPFVVSFKAEAFDPGSDDLTFTWDWGDGTSSSRTYYNDGIGPDPYPSPNVNPITEIDKQEHFFVTGGVHTIHLTVEDDDGGSETLTLLLTLS